MALRTVPWYAAQAGRVRWYCSGALIRSHKIVPRNIASENGMITHWGAFLDIRETIRVGLGFKLMDFEQSERFRAAPKLGLGGGSLCGRGTAGIVFAPHVLCESTLFSCPVCAFDACVWFDARVRPHVPCEPAL